MNNILSLLGLCLRAAKLVYGDESVAGAIAGGEARLVVLASDAGGSICKRADRYAAAGMPVIRVAEDAAQMGWALGRKATAICCITDIGLAAAAAQKIAQTDAQYAPVAQQLNEKKQRIESRRGVKKPRKKAVGSRTSDGVNHSTHMKRGGERA